MCHQFLIKVHCPVYLILKLMFGESILKNIHFCLSGVAWSLDSALRTTPELITDEPFPKLDFNIDIDSPRSENYLSNKQRPSVPFSCKVLNF